MKCRPEYNDLKIQFSAGTDSYDGLIRFSPEQVEYHRSDKLSAWWEFCNFTCGKDYDGNNPPMSYTFTVTSKSGAPVPSPVTKRIPALASGKCAHEEVELQDGKGLGLTPGQYNFALSGVLNTTAKLGILE